AGTVAARSFWISGNKNTRGVLRSAKEQCRIDNALEIACNVLWIVRLPLAQFENMAMIRR
ncbi:hypothetical protein, partial [Escherichia coli]|uniref:hypothetical protein n=1 Tax=Escherichia coli TaxID=562 RepID=UPI001BC84F80